MEASPCKECIVSIMCKKLCEEADMYVHRCDCVDIYLGRVVARYLGWKKHNPMTGVRNFYLSGKEKQIEDGDLF